MSPWACPRSRGHLTLMREGVHDGGGPSIRAASTAAATVSMIADHVVGRGWIQRARLPPSLSRRVRRRDDRRGPGRALASDTSGRAP